MRTLGILVAGWLIGGAMIVLLAIAGSEPAVAQPEGAAGAGAGEPGGALSGPTIVAGEIAIPVRGVSAAELRDTYAQARSGGRVHHAVDILAPRGTPVIAAVDGTIRKLDSSPAGGVSIYQFDRSEERVYYYAHLEGYAAGLAEGQLVRQGTVLGYVGTSGNAPEGTPHLHFSVEVLPPSKSFWKGEPLNPYELLTRRAPETR